MNSSLWVCVKVEGMSKAECPSDSSMPSKW